MIGRRKGQALTEYTMLIVVLVGVILSVGFLFRDQLRQFVLGRVGNALQQRFFNPKAMHTFPFRIPK